MVAAVFNKIGTSSAGFVSGRVIPPTPTMGSEDYSNDNGDLFRRKEAVNDFGCDDGVGAGHNEGVAPAVIHIFFRNNRAVYGEHDICIYELLGIDPDDCTGGTLLCVALDVVRPGGICVN